MKMTPEQKAMDKELAGMDDMNMRCYYDQNSVANIQHKLKAQSMYGHNVRHISDFDTDDSSKAVAICLSLPGAFIGGTFIKGELSTDISKIGIYAYNQETVTEFWDMYYKNE